MVQLAMDMGCASSLEVVSIGRVRPVILPPFLVWIWFSVPILILIIAKFSVMIS